MNGICFFCGKGTRAGSQLCWRCKKKMALKPLIRVSNMGKLHALSMTRGQIKRELDLRLKAARELREHKAKTLQGGSDGED